MIYKLKFKRRIKVNHAIMRMFLEERRDAKRIILWMLVIWFNMNGA